MRGRPVPLVPLLMLLALLVGGGLWAWRGGQSDDTGSATRDPVVVPESVPEPHHAATPRDRISPPRPADEAPASDDETEGIDLTVVDARDDEPIAGAHVRLFRLTHPLANTAWEGREGVTAAWPTGPGEFVREARSDAAGAVVLGAATGDWLFARVEAEGYAAQVVGIEPSSSIVSMWPAKPRTLRVIDAADEPIAGAVASIHTLLDDPPVATATSDAAGRLSFSAGDGHELVIRADGYASVWIESLDEWGEADVVLQPGGVIAGVVVTSDGLPVEGAVVAISEDTAFAARTAADGRFRFEGLRRTSEPYDIEAESSPDLRAEAAARVGVVDLRIVLERLAVVEGRAFESDGSPAWDVRIELPDRGVCTTPIDGWFTAGVPAGPVRIVARMLRDTGPPGGHPDTRGEVGFVDLEPMSDEQIAGVEIHMETVPASYVYFRVAAPGGERVRGYALTYDDAHDRGFERVHGTDEQGDWRRLSVPVGTPIRLRFSTARDDDLADAFEATVHTRAQPDGAPDVVQAPSADHGMVELTLTTVRTDGGAIPTHADVGWLIANRNPHRVAGLPPGSPPTGIVHVPREAGAKLMAWADGCGTLELTVPLTDAPQQSFECRLPPEAVVAGQLVTRTGRPVTRARVEVLVTRPDGTESLSVAWYDQLLPGGAFEADQLAGGAGRITVWDSDRRIIAERTFEVPEGARVELGDVVIGALPLARGTVTVDGRPAPGVGVTAGDGRRFASTSTGPDGVFELPVPRRAGAALILEADGVRVLYSLDDVLDASPVRLRADATGELRVTFDERKRDVESVAVRLPGGPRALARTALLLDRHLTLGGLPAGPVEIAITTDASAGGLRVWRGTVDVVPGATTNVTLTLER